LTYNYFPYTDSDNITWKKLFLQQLPLVKKYACKEYLNGLEKINFSQDYVPQLEEVSDKLFKICSWSLEATDKMCSPTDFFTKLSRKVFPVIRVLRKESEIDFYTNESPDLFHEYFGHCPMITNQKYSDCMQILAMHALDSDECNIQNFAKFYWASFEFGIIKDSNTTRIYGAGILPSKSEVLRVIESNNIKIKKIDVFSKLDSILQGNIHQPIYYYINSLDELYNIIKTENYMN
jgi:phenylalanine-4-hydroxylase